MILGTLVTNLRNNQILARMKDPLLNEKIEFFLLEFMNAVNKKTGVVVKDLYKYIYTFSEDNYYVLITSLLFSEVKAFGVLSHLINTRGDPLDLLVSIDNTIFGDTIVFPNLSLILSMDSQEEKIFKMMMKNKEMEVRRRQKKSMKEASLGKTGGLGKTSSLAASKLQEIHNKQVELTRKNLEDLKLVESGARGNTGVDNTLKKKKRFETSSSPIFICFKEKIKCVMNNENVVKSLEVQGEMSLHIKEEKYKDLEIKLKGDFKDCKFSPKLEKEGALEGVVRSEKSFSLHKNIALLKWKDTLKGLTPLEITFWPSEVKLNTFQISLEITPNLDLENLTVVVPKTKLKEIESDLEKDLEWRVGSLSKGDSDSLEFQCKCDDPSDIFPLEIYFTSPGLYRKIGVESVCGKELRNKEVRNRIKNKEIKEDTACVDESVYTQISEIKKVREVDSFIVEN